MNTDFYFEVLNAEDLSSWERLVIRWMDWHAVRTYAGLYAPAPGAFRKTALIFYVQDETEAYFHLWLLRRISKRTRAIIGVCCHLLREPLILERGKKRFWYEEAKRHAAGEWD